MAAYKLIGEFINKNKFFLLPFFLILAIGLCFSYVKPALELDQGIFKIDVYTDDSSTANLWVNDASHPPITAKFEAMARNQYNFKVGASTIEYMRLDPAPGMAGVNIRIYGAEILSPSGAVHKLSPKEIADWQVMNVQHKSLTNEYVEFRSGQNLILVSNAKYLIELKYPKYLHKIEKLLSQVSSITKLLAIFFALIVFFSSLKNSWSAALIFLFVYIFVVALAKNQANLDFGAITVDKAVGLAAFSGRSLEPNMIFLWVSTIISLGIPVALWIYCRGEFSANKNPCESEQIHLGWKYFFCASIIILLWFFPNMLHGVARHAIVWNGVYVPQWDSDNAITWAYMIQKGMRPFGDFWYPYGLSFMFDMSPPWGTVLQSCIMTGEFLLLLYLLHKILEGSKYFPAALIVFMLFGGLPNEQFMLFPQPERHLFPFLVGFSYLCACIGRKVIPIYYFWLITCLGLLIEPSQVAYSVLGITIIMAIDFFQNLNFKYIYKKILREFAVPIIFLVAISISFYILGYSKNIAEFYLSMGDVARYMAIPTKLDIEYLKFGSKENFLIITPFLLLAMGLYQSLITNEKNEKIAKAILMCGAIGVMMLQKHLIRPIDWALFYSSALGISLYAYLTIKNKKRLKGVILGFFSSLILITLIGSGIVYEVPKKLLASYKNLSEIVMVFVNDDRFDNLKSNVFSRTYLSSFAKEDEVLRALRGGSESVPKFYSLPDDPMLYVLAGERPPYQINGFSLSPIYEQEKIITFLKKEKIQYVILDPSRGFIDGIPYYIRLPILYKYILKNYDYYLTVNRFEILKQKITQDGLNSKVYSKLFGKNIELGSIPTYSSQRIQALPGECLKENACDDILWIKDLSTENNNKIIIPITIDNIEFNIIFNKSKNKTDYFINLNRIWFWDENKSNVNIINSIKMQPNLFIKHFISKKKNPETLY